MPTFRALTNYADGTAGATDRLLFETSANAPRGTAPADLPVAVASGANGLLSGADKAKLDGAALLASPTFTGTVTLPATQMADATLTRPDLVDYAETRSTPTITTNAATVNFEIGNVAVITLTANITTLTISNPPASGKIGTMTVWLVQDGTGGRTVTWPAAVDWGDQTAPTIASSANLETIVTLLTRDGGTSYKGILGWKKA